MDIDGGEGSQQPTETEQDAGISAPDPDAHVQRLLEELPRHVLNEACSFQESVRYLGNFDADDSSGSGSGTHAHLNERLKALLDDVVRIGGMKESIEGDILKDKGNLRVSQPYFFLVK